MCEIWASYVSDELGICEPKALEVERLGVRVWVLHHCANRCAGPIADLELGSIGKSEWL